MKEQLPITVISKVISKEPKNFMKEPATNKWAILLKTMHTYQNRYRVILILLRNDTHKG
jgi:hypothetical protein